MEPLKPETVKDLRNRPQLAPADVEEYQRLLAERFTTDPDVQRSPRHAAPAQVRAARLQELHRKLFGAPAP